MQGYTDDSTSSVSQFNGQGGPNMGKHSGPYSHSNRSYGSHHGINHPNQYPDSPNMKRRSMNSSCSMNAPGGPLGSHSGQNHPGQNFPPERHGSSLVLTQKSSTEGQSHSHSNHSVSHTLGPPNNAMQAGPASVHSGMDCNYSNISSPNSNFEHYNASCGPGSHSQQQSNCNSTRESDHDYGYRSDNYAKRERRDPGPSSRKLREGVNVNIDQNGERLNFYELAVKFFAQKLGQLNPNLTFQPCILNHFSNRRQPRMLYKVSVPQQHSITNIMVRILDINYVLVPKIQIIF